MSQWRRGAAPYVHLIAHMTMLSDVFHTHTMSFNCVCLNQSLIPCQSSEHHHDGLVAMQYMHSRHAHPQIGSHSVALATIGQHPHAHMRAQVSGGCVRHLAHGLWPLLGLSQRRTG